ncbi:MAG: peptidoglycan-associated lipoprotein Pal [Deltaproteobacteria bacterium]|nr:peptidoglycan-associated lipoprotein Pal [Deltaproteobacteria bacterium]
MQKWRITGLVVVALALLLATASCGPRQKGGLQEELCGAPTGEEAALALARQEEEAAAEAERLAAQRALEAERLAAAARERELLQARFREAKVAFTSTSIYFDFDSSRLTPEAQQILREKAEFLKNYPETEIIIEGHCDERGSNEYNMALGERRAQSAKNFLVDLGVDRNRITTISYGEERPLAKGHNEEAWSLNRRCEFVVQ